MNEDSIIEKIRSLLRLAKSDNPFESAAAMRKALEIASRHQIDLASISPEDDLNKITSDEMELPSRLAHEWKEALNIVFNYFNVHVSVLVGMDSKRAQIIGTKLDIELSSYVATFLVRSCRECLAIYRRAEIKNRRKVTPSKTQSFIKGFFWGIRDGLRQQRQQTVADHAGYQLMLDNGAAARTEFSDRINQRFGPSRQIEMPDARENRAAKWTGFAHGSKTQIRPGLGGSELLALE